MVLCDTNIFIHAFNGNPATITALTRIGTVRIVLSAITVMELLQGMGNKKELAQMKKKIKYYTSRTMILGYNGRTDWADRADPNGFLGVRMLGIREKSKKSVPIRPIRSSIVSPPSKAEIAE
jgi:PIN domain